MKRTRNLIMIGVLLLLVCATAFCLVSCDIFSNLNSKESNTGDVIHNNYDITVTNEAMGLRYATEEVIDSAVKITTTLKSGTRQSIVSGSGSIISSDGLVLTNRHVVSATGYTLQSITVTTINSDYEETSYSAELVTFSGSFDLDMRVLQITNAVGKVFKPVSIAKSESLKMGDTTFMLGNSASSGFTLSSAVVAHPKSTEFSGSNLGFEKIVKINADVNHGNSGGGLFNLKGDLVGVVTYRKEGNTNSASDMIQGIGYALRTEDILAIIKAHYGDKIYGKLTIDTYDDIYTESVKAA